MVDMLIVTSSGGHFALIRRLLAETPEDVSIQILVNEAVHGDTGPAKPIKIMHTNNYLLMLWHLFEAVYYLRKFKPKVVMSPGAAPGVIFGWVGKKLFKTKFVFVESFSRVGTPSMSGRLASKFADLYIVQHEPVAKDHPNAIYLDTIGTRAT